MSGILTPTALRFFFLLNSLGTHFLHLGKFVSIPSCFDFDRYILFCLDKKCLQIQIQQVNVTRPLIPFSLIFGQIKGNKCSIFREFKISDCFPSCPFSLLASIILACFFIVKSIIMNFLEDLDVGIFYRSKTFELDWSTNNGDLLSDRNHWTDRQADWIWYSPHIGYRVE